MTLGGGHLFEASHIKGMSDQWATVRWATPFSQAPLLFGGSVTTHGPDFVLLMRNASSHTAEGVRSVSPGSSSTRSATVPRRLRRCCRVG
eukprot:COSAG01_NODE_10727_length_2092_cov_1.142356_2_plen_90_part_00